MTLISCEIELDLSWSKECMISEISLISRIVLGPDANPPVQKVAVMQTTRTKFQINNAKLYVAVVTFSKNDKYKI